MDEGLRAELLRRMEKDQVARKALDGDGVRDADGENLPWLKAVVAERGWPGKSLVGQDGAHAAWLLVQHADRDPGFQRQCLDLIAVAVEAGEAAVKDLAYLTDRVLLAEGQQQVYGTQMIGKGGRYAPRNLRDPESVDERRAAVGLGTLAEYQRRFDEMPPLPPPRLKCESCGEWVPFEPPDSDDDFIVTCAACGHETTVRVLR